MCGMEPGLGSVSGCPHSPAATSERSDQPVSDRCVVFDFVARWKEGFMIMYIRAALMMGVFSCVCYGVLWGRGGLQCRILGGFIVSFFGVGGIGDGKRRRHGP
jgi:hypothetical protein